MCLIKIVLNFAILIIFVLLGLFHYLKTGDWILFVALVLNGIILDVHDFIIIDLMDNIHELEVGKDALNPEHPKNS